MEAGYAQRVWPHSSKAHIAGHTARPEAYDRHIAWHITAPSSAQAFVPLPRCGMDTAVPGIHPKEKARYKGLSQTYKYQNLARRAMLAVLKFMNENAGAQ